MARSKPPVTLWVLKVDKTSGISAIWFITHSGETAGALPRRDQFSRALVLCDEEEGCYTPQLRRPGPKTHRLLEQAVNTAARNKLLPFPGGIGSYMIVTLGYPFIIFSVRRGKRLVVWYSWLRCSGFSLWRLLLLRCTGSRAGGLQERPHTGSVLAVRPCPLPGPLWGCFSHVEDSPGRNGAREPEGTWPPCHSTELASFKLNHCRSNSLKEAWVYLMLVLKFLKTAHQPSVETIPYVS